MQKFMIENFSVNSSGNYPACDFRDEMRKSAIGNRRELQEERVLKYSNRYLLPQSLLGVIEITSKVVLTLE